MTLEEIRQLSLNDMTAVNQHIFSQLSSEVALINQLGIYIVNSGGKRLRPVMTIAAASVGSDKQVSDDVIQGGISCELVHLGSLYHDDVMDESSTRRGVETVNARWGNLQAILAGDFLFAKASEIAAALGTVVATLLAQTIKMATYNLRYANTTDVGNLWTERKHAVVDLIQLVSSSNISYISDLKMSAPFKPSVSDGNIKRSSNEKTPASPIDER